MSYMLNECSRLTNLNLSFFTTGNVTTMKGLFKLCEELKEFNLFSFDTKNVSDISYMIDSCYK